MPPRPFPFPVRVGIDICHIPRINALISRECEAGHRVLDLPKLNRFTRRLLTPYERRLLHQLPWVRQLINARPEEVDHPNLTGDLRKLSQHLAGRWAAKEAVVKAISPSYCGFWNIMILRDKLQPYAVVDLKQDFSRFDDPVSAGPDSSDFGISVLQKLTGQIARVSISHDGDYSTAVCMAAEEATPGDVGGEAQAREGP